MDRSYYWLQAEIYEEMRAHWYSIAIKYLSWGWKDQAMRCFSYAHSRKCWRDEALAECSK